MKRKVLSITFLAILSTLTVWNVRIALTSERSCNLSAASVKALSGEAGTGGETSLDCSYNRHPFTCSINGNGKIEVFGKGVITVKGHLDLDGGMACSGGGKMSCRNVECVDLYMWK